MFIKNLFNAIIFIFKIIAYIFIFIYIVIVNIIKFSDIIFKMISYIFKFIINIFIFVYNILKKFFKNFWMLTGGLIAKLIYMLVGVFGKASTGTAISSLHGAAKSKAIFSTIGGGSISSGGYGIALGVTILKIICVIPIIIWIFKIIKDKINCDEVNKEDK